MNTTPADPGAIDLEIIRAHYELPSSVPNSSIDALIAAVEALRMQKVELAEHLDKTIATAADAVNRMNANETEIEQL